MSEVNCAGRSVVGLLVVLFFVLPALYRSSVFNRSVCSLNHMYLSRQKFSEYTAGWTLRESNPSEGEIFRAVLTDPEALATSCSVGTWPFQGWNGRSLVLTIHNLLASSSCEWVGAVPVPPFFAYPGMSWDDLTDIIIVLLFVVWHSWLSLCTPWMKCPFSAVWWCYI
jgi:hypothetical protein